MYGLPETFDASVFVGRTLQQVAFSANSVSLWFGEDLSVTIESSFSHAASSGSKQAEKQTVPVAKSSLMQLAGKAVRSAESDRHGTLTLRFEGGHVLSVFDDLPQYESYRIQQGEDEIIV